MTLKLAVPKSLLQIGRLFGRFRSARFGMLGLRSASKQRQQYSKECVVFHVYVRTNHAAKFGRSAPGLA